MEFWTYQQGWYGKSWGISKADSEFGTHFLPPLVSFVAALTQQWLSSGKGIGLQVGKPEFHVCYTSS